jgi:DNA-binding CsgD family transcriptional regulator
MTTDISTASPASSANLAGLAALGLDPLDEQVYRGLLRRPSWPVPGLAERLGFGTGEFTGSLDRLTAMRLVRVGPEGDIQAVSPRIGLAALVASREAELADRRWELEQSRLAAAALAVEHDTPRQRMPSSTGSPDVVYGEAAVRGRVAALIGEATSSVIAISLSSGGYLDPVALPPTATHAAVRRGVTVRSVYFDRVRADPRLGGYVQELVSAGAFVRTTRGLPTSALAIDDKIVVLPVALSMTGKRPGVVLLRLPGVVTAISELFERVWAGASPLGDGTPDGLDDREHELLGLLLSGSTDESAAAQLGVSVRTVRRIVARLMETLDARSRFEAGARAVLHGWPAR